MPIRLDQPVYLLLLLLAVPIVWLGVRSLTTLEPARRWTAIVLRLSVLLVLSLMLAGLQTVRRHADLTVIAVVDRSESVERFARPPAMTGDESRPPESMAHWQRRWIDLAGGERQPDDSLGLVAFDGRPTILAMPGHQVASEDAALEQPVEGTRTAAALRSAMALFPPESRGRLLLMSDGNETAGSASELLAAAREARAAGIPVDVVPIRYQVQREVLVEGLYAPREAREGQTLALRVVLRATHPAAGRIELYHDDEPVDLNGSQPGTGSPVRAADWFQASDPAAAALLSDAQESVGDAAVAEALPEGGGADGGDYVLVRQIDLPMGRPGVQRFRAEFVPQDAQADTIAVNNRAEALTHIAGQGRILVISHLPEASARILPDALASQGMLVESAPPSGLPSRLSDMQAYDAVIFQNVPAEEITGSQQRMLARYVQDFGGGFLMIGGPDSFGAGGWTNSPIDQYLLPVRCEIPSQTIMPSGALVLVIDRSGSMSAPVGQSNTSQQQVAGEAAVQALSTLYPQDLVGVIAFDSSASWVVPLQENQDPARVAQLVRSIQPSGGTDMYPAMQQAYEALARVQTGDAAIRHMIVLTDGHSNPPPTSDGWTRLMGQMAAQGISLSTIGIGDHDAALLGQLANMGGGQYYGVLNPGMLPQVFIKEAKTIRRNLIKEPADPFTPMLQLTGSPIMTGIQALPPLRGLVLTGERRDPRVFMPMLGPEGEPLFAHWQVGLGRSAAFTSDATNRWASAWLNWGGYADFWGRTVRTISRPAPARDVDLQAEIRGERLRLRLDAAAGLGDEHGAAGERGRGVAAGGGFTNFLSVRGSVLRPDGQIETVTLAQTGPGIYEAEMSAVASGNYIFSLFVQDGDQRRPVFGGASRPPGEELRRFSSNEGILRQIAEETGGRVLDPTEPQTAGLFARDHLFESRSIRPLWRVLLWLLLVLFLLDVAVRRIAWDAAAIGAWGRQRLAVMGGFFQVRRAENAQQTLGALRQARQKRSTETADPAAAAPVPAPDRARKFEAPAGAAVPPADFASSVGGARETDSATRQAAGRATSPQAGPAGKSDGPTTSRLLAAKRRAQERLDGSDTGP